MTGANGDYLRLNSAQLYVVQKGRGPAMVFLHGFSFDSRMWQAQLDYFAANYCVLAYDARGFGRSSLPDEQSWSPVQDLHGVLEQLSLEPVIVIAHSMAAITACDYCRLHPTLVKAMVLVSPSVANYRWPEGFMAQWVAYQELAAVDINSARAAWLSADMFTRASANPVVAEQMKSMIDDYSGWHWLRKQSVSSSHLPELDSAVIGQPVLLVNGDEDSAAFLECSAYLERQLPNSRRLQIPDADHMCNMEQAELFNREVAEFVAGVSAG